MNGTKSKPRLAPTRSGLSDEIIVSYVMKIIMTTKYRPKISDRYFIDLGNVD
jgi:hypothetical protein